MQKILSALAWLGSLAGPLFTKELLVTSRRVRYYVLRFGYAAILGLVISLVWLGMIESASHASAAYRSTRMAEIGKAVVSFIVCFQFAAAQFVAVVLLSGAISEEIYQRTLVPILTTPIACWQIVAGKFLGKLLHVLLLLVISLPLMAVVRVLGGVPWGYLLAGVCVAISAAAFVGALATFFSTLCRRAYLAILAALGVAMGVYGILAGALGFLAAIISAVAKGNAVAIVLYPNPVAVMVYETWALNDPSVKAPLFYWPLHCVVMGAMTIGVLKLCEISLRRSGIRRAIGLDAGSLDSPGPPGLPPLPVPPDRDLPDESDGPARKRRWKPKGWNLRRVIVSPIFWRELRKPLLRDKVVQIVAMSAVLFYLLYTYAILAAAGSLRYGGAHAGFATTFLAVALLCTAVDAATAIAPEKQARTWPALLSTPVSDWHILLGKAAGTLFRCLAAWVFLFGHVVLFALVGVLHPVVLLHVPPLAVGSAVFVTGSGLYFSTRHRRATTAVLMNVGLALLLWVLLPSVLGLLGAAFGDREAYRADMDINPVVQAGVLAGGACRGDRVGPLVYDWPGNSRGWATTTLLVWATAAAYAAAGLLFAWRAKRMFRRNVFDA